MPAQDNLMPEIDRLRQENEQWEKSFALYWEASMRGTKMWREANPGNDLVLPDTGKLVEWLIGELDKMRVRLETDHVWQLIDGKMQRIDVKHDGMKYDGIDRRNETIRLQDKLIEELRRENLRLNPP